MKLIWMSYDEKKKLWRIYNAKNTKSSLSQNAKNSVSMFMHDTL